MNPFTFYWVGTTSLTRSLIQLIFFLMDPVNIVIPLSCLFLFDFVS